MKKTKKTLSILKKEFPKKKKTLTVLIPEFNSANSYVENYPFNDTLHNDGSKTYETFNFGYITIKNPEFVQLIEDILKSDLRGFSYVKYIQEFVDQGKDKFNEYRNVLKVLD